MKFVFVGLVAVLAGCASPQYQQVKELNAQNRLVNKLERQIVLEDKLQKSLSDTLTEISIKIDESEVKQAELEVELEKEKAILLELVK